VTLPPPLRLPPGGLAPNSTIGIIGGGQLGRMSAMAAARLGYRTHILTPETDSPAAQVCHTVTIGSYDDPDALRAMAGAVDVITFEFENVSAAGLDLLAALKPVHPAPAILRVSQDRVTEKCFINGAGAPTAPWAPVNDKADLAAAVLDLGLPAVLKTTRLGYDGRGQAVLRTDADLDAAWERLSPRPLILEGFVDFACELAVVVARGVNGQIVAFDAVENRHKNHILDVTLAPARVTPDLAELARQTACRIAAGLHLVGLLAVEMFVDRDGRILVNELAPRPHNSGHWTIDACPASQFEMHIRAIAGLPLPPAFRHSDAVMKNLVGPDDMARWPEILAAPGLIPHHYGKAEARAGRKMGHVTRLFPKGALPGELGVQAALGFLASDESAKEESTSF
jgi:5-(carboxyamino)imidazole ribonucleotide synthase